MLMSDHVNTTGIFLQHWKLYDSHTNIINHVLRTQKPNFENRIRIFIKPLKTQNHSIEISEF